MRMGVARAPAGSSDPILGFWES